VVVRDPTRYPHQSADAGHAGSPFVVSGPTRRACPHVLTFKPFGSAADSTPMKLGNHPCPIGLAEPLSIATTDDLFGSAHSLASHMSALAFPVLESTLPVRTRGERRFGLPTCCLRRRGGRGA
jgi:hypothetical protein